jgi:hypothetical protein
MSAIELCRVTLVVYLGQRTTVSSWLGLVCGVTGMLYGLRAKTFTAYGHLSSKEPQIFAPTWVHRGIVIGISGVAVITSLIFLARNW